MASFAAQLEGTRPQRVGFRQELRAAGVVAVGLIGHHAQEQVLETQGILVIRVQCERPVLSVDPSLDVLEFL